MTVARGLRLAIALLLASCATSSPQTTTPASQLPASMHGTASWVGQEFAGRTTANGEIFDPMQLTAAHRTLPFGTLLDVRNPKTNQTVRVRVNDRGPYVGDRLIDLSYAAAQQIGLADAGIGEVDVTVVKIGRGEKEPPQPYAVATADAPAVAIPNVAEPAPLPPPALPLPAPVTTPTPAPGPDVAAVPTVENIQVIEQHASGVETRRQVSASGTSIEDVPVNPQPNAPAPKPAPLTPAPAPAPRSTASHPAQTPAAGRYVVQVGAFAQEANANALVQKLRAIGQDAHVDHETLYRVRIGPFATREQAVAARARLEAAGISAIIVVP